MITERQKTDWLRRLRNGRYRQTTDMLCKVIDGKASYCCLGVLAMVCKRRKDTVELFASLDSVGLGHLLPQKTRSTLVRMNDDQGCDFTQIADWIEANVTSAERGAS